MSKPNLRHRWARPMFSSDLRITSLAIKHTLIYDYSIHYDFILPLEITTEVFTEVVEHRYQGPFSYEPPLFANTEGAPC